VRIGEGGKPGTVGIEDLGSKNGTWLNGQRVDSATAGLQDVIRVGDTFLVVCPLVWPTASRTKQLGTLIGVSAAIVEVRRTAKRIARESLTVLICGESGTGKELVAEAVHEHSGRPGRFVAINSSAIPEGLFESELFGVRKGAFSGADRDRNGYITEADKGTLFLDEIGDMPAGVQAKLLRTIEDKEVSPVGSTASTLVDVRFVAATNADIDKKAGEGTFRHDLLYRLRQFVLRLPPLRERKEDIPVLWSHFMEIEDCAWESDAPTVEALMVHNWPGNVRELKNAAAQYAIRAGERGRPSARNLPDVVFRNYKRLREGESGGSVPDQMVTAAARPVHVVDSSPSAHLPSGERPSLEALLEALSLHDGNLAAVARHFGRRRPQAYRWLEHYGIDVADVRAPPDDSVDDI